MGALKSKMGRTELGHLASQAFDLRLSSARGRLNKRVGSIRNMTTNLNRLAAVDLVNEMIMVA